MIQHGVAPYLECSTAGDTRFSAMVARISNRDFKTIEEIYQSSKIFEDGKPATNWRSAKGRPAKNQAALIPFYDQLWEEYISENPYLIDVLVAATGLSDQFGQAGHCCQATSLWKIRSRYVKS